MNLVRETETEIHFADRNMPFLYFAIIPYIGFFACLRMPSDDMMRTWLGIPGSLVLAVAFTAFGLWREELHLDVEQRSFLHRKGFWPKVKTTTGTFGDFEAVVLNTSVSPGDSDSPSRQVWSVNLLISRDRSERRRSTHYCELPAYADFERLARKLGLRAVDRTGVTEVVLQPDEIGKKTQRAPAASAPQSQAAPLSRGHAAASHAAVSPGAASPPLKFPPPPWSTRIQISGGLSRKTVTLPPMQYGAAAGWRCLFYAVLVGAGASLLVLSVAAFPRHLAGDLLNIFPFDLLKIFGFVLGPLILVTGALQLWNEVQKLTLRTTVEDLGGAIRFHKESWGRKPRITVMSKKEIRGVALKRVLLPKGPRPSVSGDAMGLSLDLAAPSGNSGLELEVRSRSEIVHLGDRLSAAELDWLRQAVTAMAQSQQTDR